MAHAPTPSPETSHPPLSTVLADDSFLDYIPPSKTTLEAPLAAKLEVAIKADKTLKIDWCGDNGDEGLACRLGEHRFSLEEIVSILKAAPFNRGRTESGDYWRLIAQKGINEGAAPECPECKYGRLHKKTNKASGEPFWACDAHPDCKYTTESPVLPARSEPLDSCATVVEASAELSPAEASKALSRSSKTLVAEGKPKNEVISQLKKQASAYKQLLSDAEAEVYYKEAYVAVLGYSPEWYPRPLNEIANRTWDKPHSIPWTIEGILPAQSSLLCSGQPHATKSLDWLAASMEAPIRHTVWGKFDASNVKRTLYIEAEDPDWLVENRIIALMKGLGLSRTDDLEKFGFHFSATGPFDLVKKEQEIQALINHVKPDFTVLSTLQGLIPGRSLNEQRDMSEPNAMVVRLSKLTPLIVITHSPRNTDLKRSYGTIVQDANYLTLLHFEKHDKDGVTTINVTGDSKLGTELNFKLRLVTEIAETTEVRSVVHMDYLSDTKSRIIACNEANPAMPATEIAESVGCSYEYARRVLKDARHK